MRFLEKVHSVEDDCTINQLFSEVGLRYDGWLMGFPEKIFTTHGWENKIIDFMHKKIMTYFMKYLFNLDVFVRVSIIIFKRF